jgi:fructoselysine-6-P-deglycase FrlB-like protein
MRARGAAVLSIAGQDADVTFDADARLHPLFASPLYLPIGQLLAYERAVARGLDPDRPHNLEAVVILDDEQ